MKRIKDFFSTRSYRNSYGSRNAERTAYETQYDQTSQDK